MDTLRSAKSGKMSDDKSPIEEDPLEWLKDLETETRSLLGTCVRVS